MENSLTRVIRPSHAEVRQFLDSAGDSLSSFRYFSKKDVSVIDNHIFTILYRRGSEHVGYGHLDKEDGVIWLGICISEKERGRGLGKIIMQDLTNFARERRLELSLSVDNDNSHAISLYEKFGFTKTSQSRNVTFMKVSFQDSGYYTRREITDILGITDVGENVKISRKVSVYGGKNIKIGSNVRIDDYCVISASGEMVLEGYNHIAAFCYINSRGGFTMRVFSGISSRCSVYTATDDYTGEYLTGPTVPEIYTNVTVAPVVIGRHAIVGTGSTILPGVNVGDRCSVGAHSLVNKSTPDDKIVMGIPAKAHRERSKGLLHLERQLLEKLNG